MSSIPLVKVGRLHVTNLGVETSASRIYCTIDKTTMVHLEVKDFKSADSTWVLETIWLYGKGF